MDNPQEPEKPLDAKIKSTPNILHSSLVEPSEADSSSLMNLVLKSDTKAEDDDDPKDKPLRFDQHEGERKLRKSWVIFCYVMTWFIPPFLLTVCKIQGKGTNTSLSFRSSAGLERKSYALHGVFLCFCYFHLVG